MRLRSALAIGALLVLAACARDPQEPVDSQPASAALTRNETANASPAVAVAQPEAAPSTSATIVVAQVGWKLNSNGLLDAPATAIPAGTSIYGMAIFRGVDSHQGRAELHVYDAGERQVAAQEARYTVKGDTSVMFSIPASRLWPRGSYRALFRCDGNPCWEIRFAVQ